MIEHFSDDATWDAFEREAMSWLGTPYRHCTAVKGRGADCTLWIGSCWVAVGILKKLSYHYYPKDWYVHRVDERILEGLYSHFREHAVEGFSIKRYTPEEQPKRGDVLSLSINCAERVSNHAALYLGGDKVLHAAPRQGVIVGPFGHWLQPRITNVFRIMRST